MTSRTPGPADVWQTAYGELQLQLPRETFDTWLRTARLIAHEDGTYIIGVHNIYAREWLEHRLKKVIVRTMSRIAGRTVEVRFVLSAEHKKKADREKEKEVHEAGPLLAPLKPEQQPEPRFERLPAGETGLNARQTFDTYAVGACNRLAHAAAQAVLEAPGEQFNPLYVTGGIGVGKTHMLHAIGNAFAERGHRVLYISAETFTNDLVGAIRRKNTPEFRAKYREVDVLLVDDVHFLAGKESTQEEFFHTFNALFNANAQIVLASNDAPGDIAGLDAHLRSRFEGGLVVKLDAPDYLTRMDILEIKTELRGFGGRIPLDVMEALAESVTGSVRELEGALNRVIASVMLTGEVPDVAEIAQRPGASAAAQNAEATVEDIIIATADAYGVTPEALCGRSRSRDVSTARQVAMYLASHDTDASLQQIGDAIGGRNHSTVLYSVERVDALVQTDSALGRQVQAIRRTLRPEGSPTRRNPLT